MLRQIEKLGLKTSLRLVFALFLALTFLVTAFTLERVVRRAAEASVERHARGEMGIIATLAAAAVARQEAPDAGQALANLVWQVEATGGDQDVAFVVVETADGSVLAKSASRDWLDRVNQVFPPSGGRRHDAFQERDGLYLLSVPVPPAADPSGAPVAWVLSGLSADPVNEVVAGVRLSILVILVVAAAVLLGVLHLGIRNLVLRPLTAMSGLAEKVSESDLTGRAEVRSGDELGRVAESLNRIIGNLGETVQRIRGVSEAVAQVIERATRTGATVAEGAGTVSARVAETGRSMSQMLQSLKGIAENVEVLAKGAEESSSSIVEMAATNDEVAENIGQLAGSVGETTAAIEEMTYSIKEVAKNVEQLSATAEQTSSSMSRMHLSIGQVESNANETARLSEQATRDAELGAESIGRTLAGIDKIKASSKEAATVIEQLGRRIGTVGNILGVIDDVAEQTNLLALNAAILAAQSGEHGKGFAVVADEIKDLAERTGASTKEIAELIRSVQDESQNAVHAMERGVKNVEEGVRLGQEAETALKKIQASSQRSTQMVKAIAAATVEQARGSKDVTGAISRIAETVQQIATATSEQARGSEQIMKSAEKMKVITKYVERSSQEQATGSKQITRSIESIGEMANQLNRAQRDQTREAEAALGTVRDIKEVAEAQTGAVRELEAAIQDLARQADVLRTEVRRFRT